MEITARKISGWISVILLWSFIILSVIGAVSYWTGVWGGVGFFGSILTLPISTLMYVSLYAFSSLEAFITMGLWIGAIILFSKLSEEPDPIYIETPKEEEEE